MQEVCLALAPAGIAGIILYGFNAALLIAICVATCVLSEFVWQKATKQPVTIADWSAVVTGLLLAYNLPATAPWWVAVIGSILAIVVVKQFFGGIGSNFMNPALTARAVLFISWSGIMGAYPKANPFQFTADAVTGATPLATLNGGTTEGINLMDLLLGNHGGVLGETCAIAIILGFFKIPVTQLIEIRFAMLPIAVSGCLFGPVVGGIVGMVADIGGYLVKPTGPFFPGFTITSMVSGVIFGCLLYRQKPGPMRILMSQIVYTIICGVLLNSLWLSMLYGNGFIPVLTARFVKEMMTVMVGDKRQISYEWVLLTKENKL